MRARLHHRLLASVMLGAILPLAFFGSLLLRPESRGVCGAAACAQNWDLLAFYIIQPALLFGMMVFSAWTLMRQLPRD